MVNVRFKPQIRKISDITNSNPCVVTTTEDHGYLSGLVVNLFFPADFGMNELAKYSYEITVLSETTFSIAVDTTGDQEFDTSIEDQTAQVIPIGETNDDFVNRYRNISQ